MVNEKVISFREATPQDAVDIASTHIASWRVAYKGIMPDRILDGLNVLTRSQSWEKILIDTELPCLIIKDHGKIIGFVHLSRSRDPDRTPDEDAEITSIYLDPRYYRQGYGTELMARAIKILSDHNFSRIDLWVLEENLPARRFYEKLGFVQDGGTKTHEKSGLVEIRFTKYIDMPA